MLYFLVKRDHAIFVARIRSKLHADDARLVSIVAYEDLLSRRCLDAGTYVFTSLGVLGPAQRKIATEAWDRLNAAGCRLLNHPTRSLGRYELLSEMHRRGLSDFRAYRVEDLGSVQPRYPVFIRQARHHTGSLTGLLADESALRGGLQTLVSHGFGSDDLLVIEFCDTRDEHGVYRKYSAMRLADGIYPRYVDFSRDWVVKRSDSKVGGLLRDVFGESRIREEYAYVSRNPHREWIRDVFDAARIEYGRIDYGLKDGRPQVWEINTAPTFGSGLGHIDPKRREVVLLRRPTSNIFYEGFLGQMKRLASSGDAASAPVPVEFEPKTIEAARSEIRSEEKAALAYSMLDKIDGLLGWSVFDGMKRLARPAVLRVVRKTW